MKAPARTRSIRLTRPHYDVILRCNPKLLQLAFEQCKTKAWDLQGVVLTGLPPVTYGLLNNHPKAV